MESKSTICGSSRKMKSRNSSASRCSKERAMEEKAKMAELMAKAEFMQQRQMVENQAEQLRVQESWHRPRQDLKFIRLRRGRDQKLINVNSFEDPKWKLLSLVPTYDINLLSEE